MDRAMPREDLSALLDQVIREITQCEAGIVLSLADQGKGPEGEVCTVYTSFERGLDTRLSLCADMSMFVRMAYGVMQTDELTPQDVEDVAKEYFNVLCGYIISHMFRVTKMPARFKVPSFCLGRHIMNDSENHIILNYIGDRNERAQLIHHTPCRV